MEKRRVVVTGLGAISCLGNDVETNWHKAANGISGIDYFTKFDISDLRVRFGGEVRDFDPKEVFGHREARRMDPISRFAMEAARQAMTDSGLEVTDSNRYDVGALVGCGMGGLQTLLENMETMNAKGPAQVSPLAVPMLIPDAPSGKISIYYGLRGPSMCIATACATGNNAIGEATEIIRRGAAKAMLAGSTEAAVERLSIASFDNMQALSRRNDDPQTASRPFDRDRDGFVMAEGAAVLVLEELEHARARGAKIYCEIAGYGSTSDAYHITAPLETGESAAECMRKALHNAGIEPAEVSYLNAHGTSTPLNDLGETNAIKAVFGECAYGLPISSTKSVTGHMLGAASAIEAVLCIKAIEQGFIPPTATLQNPDLPDCDLDYVPGVGRKASLDVVMSNSFGFGGHNAVIVFRKHSEDGRA
ncbi:MAG: beta-ketoacyl-ACP synthase II [Anaerolineae bacterium]|nr:beta-ketoacyl-ACP synthase II [Anaerolineae bacterium]